MSPDINLFKSASRCTTQVFPPRYTSHKYKRPSCLLIPLLLCRLLVPYPFASDARARVLLQPVGSLVHSLIRSRFCASYCIFLHSAAHACANEHIVQRRVMQNEREREREREGGTEVAERAHKHEHVSVNVAEEEKGEGLKRGRGAMLY